MPHSNDEVIETTLKAACIRAAATLCAGPLRHDYNGAVDVDKGAAFVLRIARELYTEVREAWNEKNDAPS
jgi:hypothetical protein